MSRKKLTKKKEIYLKKKKENKVGHRKNFNKKRNISWIFRCNRFVSKCQHPNKLSFKNKANKVTHTYLDFKRAELF